MKLSDTASDERMEWKAMTLNLFVAFGEEHLQH